MSDRYAARSLDAGPAGLDLVMPGPQQPYGDALVSAVEAGKIKESGDLLRRPDGGRGTEVRFLAAQGAVLGSELCEAAGFNWLSRFLLGVPISAVATVKVRTVLQAAAAGSLAPPQAFATLALDAGAEVELVLRHRLERVTFGGEGAAEFESASFQLNIEAPYEDDDAAIERAAALAAAADVAVVVVGTTEEVESEGFDRASLALPGRQNERVAAANPRTVVVVNSGAPVLLPWADRVAAVLVT